MLYLSGSLAISYAVAMGLRVLAIVAPNDKVRFSDKNVCKIMHMRVQDMLRIILFLRLKATDAY